MYIPHGKCLICALSRVLRRCCSGFTEVRLKEWSQASVTNFLQYGYCDHSSGFAGKSHSLTSVDPVQLLIVPSHSKQHHDLDVM